MKRLLRVPVLLAVLLFGSGCSAFSDGSGTASDRAGRASGGTITVATAFYPLQFLAERIGGDRVEVDNLTSPGQEPHDLELSVQQTAQITDADLVVIEADLQPGVADTVAENATGTILEVEDVVELEDASHDGHDHGAEDEHAEGSGDEGDDGHDHSGIDPHFWQDPARMAEMADAVADRLTELSPDNAATFRANAATLTGELDELDAAYAGGLASCERDAVVVSHDAFGYLSRYGLEFYPIAGLSPDAEPTPADLAALQDLIASDGITTVFGETLVSPRLAETLANDTGVTAKVLDPIEGLTDDTADHDYLSLMKQNLEALKEANGCQ